MDPCERRLARTFATSVTGLALDLGAVIGRKLRLSRQLLDKPGLIGEQVVRQWRCASDWVMGFLLSDET